MLFAVKVLIHIAKTNPPINYARRIIGMAHDVAIVSVLFFSPEKQPQFGSGFIRSPRSATDFDSVKNGFWVLGYGRNSTFVFICTLQKRGPHVDSFNLIPEINP